jgi:hypothetical protein
MRLWKNPLWALREILTQSSCIIIYCNRVALSPHFDPWLTDLCKEPLPMSPSPPIPKPPKRSVLAWPAWLRVLAVLPALVLLWLAVLWATLEAAPL